MVAQIILCVLAADLLSGLIHWWEDQYGNPKWPLLGKHVIEPNILHHQQPTFFVHMSDIFSRNWQVVLPLAAIAGGLWLAGWLSWQLALVCVIAASANETHAWAHVRPQCWLPRLLVDTHLTLSPQQHARHHRPPYDRYYCTVTNVMNPLLELICFWRTLEGGLRVVGVRPIRERGLRGVN